jgi:transcriptional regulator with XRE-family HTH domain
VTIERARALRGTGMSTRQIAAVIGVSKSHIGRWLKAGLLDGPSDRPDVLAGPLVRYEGVARPSATYEEFIKVARVNQSLRRQTSWSNERIGIDLRDRKEPVLILGLSDLHVGSWGADYETLDRFTRFVESQAGRVMVVLVGDLINLAIKLRGVLEVKDDMFPPEMQHEFVALWLDKIAPFTLAAGWGNHDVEREELGSGASLHKYIMARRVPWFNGIGRCDIHLGTQTYRMGMSHRFKGSGTVNVTRGQHQFMKEQVQDVELAIAGDLHNPAVDQKHYGEHHRVAINLGSLHLNSGFAKRYFAPRTEPIFPCVEIYPDQHLMNAYWSVNHWLKATGQPLERLEPAQYVDYRLEAS